MLARQELSLQCCLSGWTHVHEPPATIQPHWTHAPHPHPATSLFWAPAPLQHGYGHGLRGSCESSKMRTLELCHVWKQMHCGRKGPVYFLSLGTYSIIERKRERFSFLSARHSHVHTKMSLHLIVLYHCCVVHYVPYRFIIIVNIVNMWVWRGHPH